MVFRLKSHTPQEQPPNFYIQCKGDHSGRPLKKPIPNCFAVYTDCENLYGLVYALYVGGLFKILIRGSVIPFITIEETKKLIGKHVHLHVRKDMFDQIENLDSLKEVTKQKLKLMDQLQKAYCLEALKPSNELTAC